ncbi:unnamed protein product [Amoebophrya sp. A25]|nr:unnamed protein product [Amoebophrya sp. A25]|eukprot:GSA25T00012829001.1
MSTPKPLCQLPSCSSGTTSHLVEQRASVFSFGG